ncbi:hypothetical protein BCR44DRAFT_1446928 [Catenaria anguillulae PL171]|uniref:Ankyrin repeat-containing domain protein n=1 Tax=Catenaria anguillulae PL171 TaxID=765915 RepID=A0A1Y2H7I3_9FUNG|nr:hypothetical protein BCR44DRAFT_1446928 [Catenaria anguillulae PL171]
MNETSCNLPDELVRPIIILLVRSLPTLLLPPDQVTLASFLNVAPHHVAPEASHIGITKMPHMRMEIGARIGSVHLLDLLLTMTQPPFNRPLQYKQDKVIRLAIERGFIHVLDWWVAKGLPLGNKIVSYSQMPNFGSDQVRNWCLDHGFVFHPDAEKKGMSATDMDWTPDLTAKQACALDLSANGRLFALEWWLKDYGIGLETQVDGTKCMLVALCCGHFKVAHWWIKNELCPDLSSAVVAELTTAEFDFLDSDQSLVFAKRVVDAFIATAAVQGELDMFLVLACANGQIELAQYYFGHPSRLTRASLKDYASHLYSFAAALGHVHVLDWLYKTGFPLNGHSLPCPTLDAFMYSYSHWEYLVGAWQSICPGIETSSCVLLLDLVSAMGHIAVLDWFRRRLDPQQFGDLYAKDAMDEASRQGHTDVLQWWLDSGLDYKYSGRAIKKACTTGNLEVLDWWDKSGIFTRKRKWASFGQMGEWLSSYQVFEWWLRATRATHNDLEKLRSLLTCCNQWTIIEWFRRHHDPAILAHASVASVISEDFHSAYPAVLTVFLAHEPAAVPVLTEYYFGLLANRGDTVVLEQLRHLGLLPEVINLDRMDESEVFGGGEDETDDWVWPIGTLDWLLTSDHPFEWSEEAFKTCTRLKRVHLLEWWAASGLEIKVPPGWNPASEWNENESADAQCVDEAKRAVLRWWWDARSDLLSF